MVDRLCELILCLLTSPKCDLDEVEKGIIQVADCHFEVIFCFLTNRKFFQVYKRPFKWQMALKSHILPLDKPKIRLWLC